MKIISEQIEIELATPPLIGVTISLYDFVMREAFRDPEDFFGRLFVGVLAKTRDSLESIE